MTGLRIHFYATGDDLESVIRDIEALASFQYALTGLHESRQFPVYSSALEIPAFGCATADSAVGSDSYLVVPQNAQIIIRDVPQRSGEIRYAVDQLENSNSIRFQPGGLRNGHVVIHGVADTIGQNDTAKEIFKLFSKNIKKSFTKRQSYYVGPSAMKLKNQGFRLTMAVKTSPEYDLA